MRHDKKDYTLDIKTCFNKKTGSWEHIPSVVRNNTEVRSFIVNLPMTSVARRGFKYKVFVQERKSYTRNNIATMENIKYDRIINSLNKHEFEVWEFIKRGLSPGCNAVKLNVPIVQQITGLKDYSNANKVIRKLVSTGIITKVEGYKDLYSIDVNLYFKGDYNSWVTEYLNKRLDCIDYSCDMSVDEDVPDSYYNSILDEGTSEYGESEH